MGRAVQRIHYFRNAATADANMTIMSLEAIQALIEKFIHRDDEELARLKKERRVGRPSSGKEDLLKQRQETEEREWETGFREFIQAMAPIHSHDWSSNMHVADLHDLEDDVN